MTLWCSLGCWNPNITSKKENSFSCTVNAHVQLSSTQSSSELRAGSDTFSLCQQMGAGYFSEWYMLAVDWNPSGQLASDVPRRPLSMWLHTKPLWHHLLRGAMPHQLFPSVRQLPRSAVHGTAASATSHKRRCQWHLGEWHPHGRLGGHCFSRPQKTKTGPGVRCLPHCHPTLGRVVRRYEYSFCLLLIW